MEDVNFAPLSRDSTRNESSGKTSSTDEGQRNSLQPTRGPVEDDEEVGESVGESPGALSRPHEST